MGETVTVGFQVVPLVPEDRVYPVVDRVIEMIAASGVKYEVGAMETTMEGDIEVLLSLVVRAQEICIAEGATRVISSIKIDYRPGGVTIDEKIGKYRP